MDGALQVRAPGASIIKGEVLERLKNGRTVRLDLELTVLANRGGAPTAQRRQTFVLSYDLWEERFAVTQSSGPSRSISHLSLADAEAWCLQRVAVPTGSLGSLGRDAPLWIRLEFSVHDDESTPNSDADGSYSLRGLIERLSRRRRADALNGSLEAGPFRIRN
jgi:hypothetical protein